MTAQSDLRDALRDWLGPALRARGFKGSAPTWSLTNDRGDVAFINVQSSTSSTKDQVRCIVNYSVAPESWVRFAKWRSNGRDKRFGLYSDRIDAPGGEPRQEQWWNVSDPASARVFVRDVLAELDAWGWDLFDRLMTPTGMLDAVRAGDLGFAKRTAGWDPHFAEAEAVLVMDNGPSDHLERLLEVAVTKSNPVAQEHLRKRADWIREQARQATPTQEGPTEQTQPRP